MKKKYMPEQEVFWFLDTTKITEQLSGDHEADVVIIGGGMAGLSAAQECHKKGLRTIVLEQHRCGGGASGRSSGFITPNAELGLTHFVNHYGPTQAKHIWDFVTAGVKHIENTIATHSLDCDYLKHDCLVVATSAHGFKELSQEHANYHALNYESTLYTQANIREQVNSAHLHGGMQFDTPFGIRSYKYLQGVKRILIDSGIKIFEETPVVSIEDHRVVTARGTVKANHIVVCADRFTPHFTALYDQVFQVQTFLMMSSPLDTHSIRTIFPHNQYMVWDTDLIYQYYRLTGDNRLMLGGGTLWQSFSYTPTYNAYAVYKKLTAYIKRQFPDISVTFDYMWPGLIGITKDLMPIVGPDQKSPSIYYVAGATGLPWACALGRYAIEHIVDNRTDFDALFSPYRTFPLGHITQHVLGKPTTFALSNFLATRS